MSANLIIWFIYSWTTGCTPIDLPKGTGMESNLDFQYALIWDILNFKRQYLLCVRTFQLLPSSWEQPWMGDTCAFWEGEGKSHPPLHLTQFVINQNTKCLRWNHISFQWQLRAQADKKLKSKSLEFQFSVSSSDKGRVPSLPSERSLFSLNSFFLDQHEKYIEKKQYFFVNQRTNLIYLSIYDEHFWSTYLWCDDTCESPWWRPFI